MYQVTSALFADVTLPPVPWQPQRRIRIIRVGLKAHVATRSSTNSLLIPMSPGEADAAPKRALQNELWRSALCASALVYGLGAGGVYVPFTMS